jgi:hypothetical protein
LLAECTSFEPHAEHGFVPDKVLDEFCSERSGTFLGAVKLINSFGSLSLEEGAEKTIKQMNLLQVGCGASDGRELKQVTFQNCPWVWDMGASFGLTPFRGDFLDYVGCKITVRDISKENTVIGVGTTLHKFKIDGQDIFIPCLSYHLPLRKSGFSVLKPIVRFMVDIALVVVITLRSSLTISGLRLILIGRRQMCLWVLDCSVSAEEMKLHGPFIRLALPQCERKVDFLGGWSSEHYKRWQMATQIVDMEYGHYSCSSGFGLPNVAVDENANLSSAQKELLLWHWKLGISMQRVQELMRVVEVEEPDGRVLVKDRVICPRIRSAASCLIPLCQSCQMS